MNHISKLAAAAAFGLVYTSSVLAADANHAAHHAPAPAAENKAPMSEGEIKKVDKEGGKLTIKHGPLDNLGMPGMTMVFRVKDPAMLAQVKTGDKIRFVADKADGGFAVSKLEVAK